MSIHRVGVLMGGLSAEQTGSLASGTAITEALREKGYDVHSVEVQQGNDWARRLVEASVDAVFVALQGSWAEGGYVQGMCEVFGLPYTGSDVLASALAMDKVKAKEVFRQYNVPTPPHYVFREDQPIEDLEREHGAFGFPVVVKPRRGGRGLGVQKVESMEHLESAIKLAREFDTDVIVERFIRGKEIQVALLDGRILGAIEVVPGSGAFGTRTRQASGAEFFLPARVAPTRYLGLLNLAQTAAKSVGCSGPCLVDMLVTEGENEYVLEVNSAPVLEESSSFARIAEAAGYPFSDLVEAVLQSASLHSLSSRDAAPASRPQPKTIPSTTAASSLARAV